MLHVGYTSIKLLKILPLPPQKELIKGIRKEGKDLQSILKIKRMVSNIPFVQYAWLGHSPVLSASPHPLPKWRTGAVEL